MASNLGELVSVRAVHALIAAGRAAGVALDADRYAPPPVSGHHDELVSLECLAICSRALYRAPREDVGLAIGCGMSLDGTGLWGLLLRSSPTYGAMLERGARFIRIVSPVPEFEVRLRGPHAVLVCPHPSASTLGPRHHVATAMLSHWIAWGRELTGVDFPVVEARIGGPAPAEPSPWRRFFRGRIVFGCAHEAYAIEREVLTLPLREGAPELSEELEELARLLLVRLEGSHPFADRVERLLGDAPRGGVPDARHVAARLAMTPRTMRRRLARDGVTFREVRDRWLHLRAERLLRRRDLALQEVARRSGYADPTAFGRAFRRRTGMTPGAWRGRLAAR